MLTQKEWLDIIVAKTGCSKKEAKTILSCSFEYIKELLSEDNPIKIQGFGVFKIKKVAAREIMNLQTKEMEMVPEHNSIVFKPNFDIDYKPDIIETEDEELEFVEESEEIEEEELVDATETNEEISEEIIDTNIFDDNDIDVAETEELDIFDFPLTWVFEGKELNSKEIVNVLKEKTSLSEVEVRESLQVVIDNMLTTNKTICEVRECDDSFDFVILK